MLSPLLEGKLSQNLHPTPSSLHSSTWDDAYLLNWLFTKYPLNSRKLAREEGYRDDDNRYLALLVSHILKMGLKTNNLGPHDKAT